MPERSSAGTALQLPIVDHAAIRPGKRNSTPLINSRSQSYLRYTDRPDSATAAPLV